MLHNIKIGTPTNGESSHRVKMLFPVNSWEQYEDMRNTPSQMNLLRTIMDKTEGCNGKDAHTVKECIKEEKRQLAQFCYSCVPNADGTLKGSTTPGNTVGMDIDNIPEEEVIPLAAKIFCHIRVLKLVMMEKSASGRGLHIVFWRNPELSQEENLQWAAEQVGVEYDKGAKDITRVFYTTPTESSAGKGDYLLFVDTLNLFKNSPEDEYEYATKNFAYSRDEEFMACVKKFMAELKAEREKAAEEGTEEKFNFALTTGTPAQKKADDAWEQPVPEGLKEHSFKGLPYSEIIKEWLQLNGGEPAVGERNTVLSKLAFALRAITDNNCQLMLEIIPSYGLDEKEMRRIITSAHKSDREIYITPQMQKAIDNVQKMHMEEDDEDCGLAPKMPEKLPPLIEDLLSNTPEIYKPAVAHAVFPALGAHLRQTRFKYIDGVEHEATLMNVLMAGTGVGKSCISKPIDYIMQDIRERDIQSRQLEADWKNAMHRCAAKDAKPDRPEGIVVQEVHPDMTNPAFVNRLQEAGGRFLYCQMNEIEQFDSLQKQGAKNAQFQIMKLAFDPDNNYGQERYSSDGLCGSAQIRFNWNASTTILKGQRYFRNVLTDGPISRINFCTIPEQPIGAPMPVFGKYGADFAEKLRPYIENLNNARGLIECPQATALAHRLDQEVKAIAIETQDRVYENLSHRANVIAYLKAMVLFVASGGQWDERTEEFIRWSLHYDLWCKMHFFGEAIRKVEEMPVFDGLLAKKCKKGSKGLLGSLPLEFSYEQLLEVREKLGKSNEKKMVMDQLRKWVQRGTAEPVDADAAENKELWDKTMWRQLNRV